MRNREGCAELRRVGIKLREIREMREMSQNQLAVRAEISQKMISLYENGKHRPTIEILVRISKALRVDINCFFEWDPGMRAGCFPPEAANEACRIDDPGLLKKVICNSIDALITRSSDQA